ncbi:protein of unknown function [Caballeronia sp. S22]
MATGDTTGSGVAAKSGANIVGSGVGDGPGPDVMAASTLEDTTVITSDGEDVGKIKEIMLDVRSGRVAYAVLWSGGFSASVTHYARFHGTHLRSIRTRKCSEST